MTNLNNFKRSLEFVLRWEGGYSFDSRDPGGETKWGISKRAHPDVDIRNLTPEQAASIYETEYWDKAGCDAIPFPQCVAVLDTAVNCGVTRVVNWLKRTSCIEAFIQERVNHYTSLVEKNPALKIYFKGWINRVNDLKKYLELNAVESDSA